MLKRLKAWLLTGIMVAVDEKRVITFDEKTQVLKVGGQIVPKEYLTALKQEAAMMKKLYIWDIYQNTIASHAREIMFEKSQTFDDMMTGKLMLYNLNILKNILNIIERYEIKDTKPANPHLPQEKI
jgi:hypothetical protein